MKVYPYRQADGHRSVLEAVDLDDAKQWLNAWDGTTELCEVEMTRDEFRATILSDNKSLVDYFLVHADEIHKVGQ